MPLSRAMRHDAGFPARPPRWPHSNPFAAAIRRAFIFVRSVIVGGENHPMKNTKVRWTALAVSFAATAAFSLASIPTTYPSGSGPASVAYGADGKLVYSYEANGDTLPDFSRAGYGGGGVLIPNVSVVTTLNAPSGDATATIQSAIDALAAQPLGGNGFRGAIKLNAGVYHISAPLTIGASGIVLRGAGSGTSGTILRRTSANGDAITADNGGGTSTEVTGTRHTIATGYVPVGATWFALDSTSGLAVGDSIMVVRNTTDAWVANLPDAARTSSSYGNTFDRIITEIDSNRTRLDAPVTLAIDSNWGGGSVYKYPWTSRLSNIGIEDIRADAPGDNVDADGNTDGNFATFSHVINGWVQRCYNDRMRGHTMNVDGSKFITVEDVTSFHGGSGSHSGPSIQNFTGSYSDCVLFHRLTTTRGGFEFTAGSHNSGPVVFCESTVPDGFAASGPHQQSNAGTLYDILAMNQSISVQYQSHGWGGFNQLAWNCETSGTYNFERPATVHQWLQGCLAASIWNPAKNGSNPEVLSWGTHLEPGSLYRAQLAERVGKDQMTLVLDYPDGANLFLIDPTDVTRTIAAGQNTTYGVATDVSPRFGGQTITFSVSGLPGGASASFSPATRTSAGSTTMTVTTSTGTPPGTYNLHLKGTGTLPTYFGSTNTVTRSGFVTLVVTAGGAATTYEAESLAISGSSGDTTTTNSEAGASGGQYIQYAANAVGDFITFTVPNVSPANYTLSVGFKKYNNRAIVQTAVGAAGGSIGNIGSPVDLYANPSSFTEVVIGTWSIGTAGNKSVRFTVTGKNAASSGYNIAVDYIKLTPQ
jgi:hypothetical protein